MNESACETLASTAIAVAPIVAKMIATLVDISGVTGAAVLVTGVNVGKTASERSAGAITPAFEPIGVRRICTNEPVDTVTPTVAAVLVIGVSEGIIASARREESAIIDELTLMGESVSAALIVRAGDVTLATAPEGDKGDNIASA